MNLNLNGTPYRTNSRHMDSTPMDSMRMKIRSLLMLGWAIVLALVFAFLAGRGWRLEQNQPPAFIPSPQACADEVHPLGKGPSNVACSNPMHRGELREQVGISFLMCRCARSDASTPSPSSTNDGGIAGVSSIGSLASSM